MKKDYLAPQLHEYELEDVIMSSNTDYDVTGDDIDWTTAQGVDL